MHSAWSTTGEDLWLAESAQGRTVQDQLNQALSAIAGHDIRCLAAGRTDTGVHASHQVVHFDSDASRPLTAWVRGVNRFTFGYCGENFSGDYYGYRPNRCRILSLPIRSV